jgi:ubiquitin C-terminal hydrolase
VGLENLGNTCYMNSSLQALMHTEPLAEYFLSQAHHRDLNVLNKFGYGGRLAGAFGELALELWTTNKKSINPKQFISEVGSLKRQFAGNEQHDAQEMLAFLLDGLSEELNLVHDKPYVEHPDSDNRPDAVLADIWWANHLSRDLSVMQSLFTGQFKSVMTCTCGYTSARFEPFNFLPVPLPEETHRTILVHVVTQALPYAMHCAVKVTNMSPNPNNIPNSTPTGLHIHSFHNPNPNNFALT